MRGRAEEEDDELECVCGSPVVYFQGWSHFPFIACLAVICVAPLKHPSVAGSPLFLLVEPVVLLSSSVTSVGLGLFQLMDFT